MLTRAHGKVTPAHVDRVGKLAGPMGADLDKIFAENLGHTYVTRTKTAKVQQQLLTRKFVSIYSRDNLICYQPRRQNPSFPKFQYSTDIKNPEKMKQAIVRHCKRVDYMTTFVPTGQEANQPGKLHIVEPEDGQDEDNEDEFDEKEYVLY